MNAKTIIAGIISAVITFLLGWLVYGMLLMDFFNSNSLHYGGLMKDPPTYWAIGVANLCWGLMGAYILSLAGANTASKGAMIGFLVFGLSTAGFDAMTYAQTNWMGAKALAVDVAVSAVFGAVSGAVIGFIYGRKSS